MIDSQFDLQERLEAIYRLSTMTGSTGGLLKRIDENRQIFELLQSEAPDFIQSHLWIEGWLEANDSFFTQLQQILCIKAERTNYPRAWPENRSE